MQEHRQALEVVARSHQRHARRGPGLPDGANAFAAHLRDLRKRVFHPCPDLANAPVAPLLAFAQGLVWPGFALDVLAIAQRTQHLAALITGIAPVGVHGPAGVVLIAHQALLRSDPGRLESQIGDLVRYFSQGPSGFIQEYLLPTVPGTFRTSYIDAESQKLIDQINATIAAWKLAQPLWGTAFGQKYTRDALGRITRMQEVVLGQSDPDKTYQYDTAGRLTGVTVNGISTTWGYDANGNRTHENGQAIATYDSQDKLQSWRGTTYQYNAAGDLTQKRGAAGTSTYRYDSQGNLRQVTLEDGRRIDYAIDPDNRRVGKKINGQLQWQMVWQDSLRPIARLKADGSLEATYYYADSPNVPAAMSKAGKLYRIIGDHLGSVRVVIDAETGEIAQRMNYDAWGQVVMDTNPGFQPFGFAGGIYDPDTRLSRFGARDYDAETGRWTAKDPILFKGGDSNLFGYVKQDPISKVDPSGRVAIALPFIPVIITGVDIAIGAGIGAIGYGLDRIFNRPEQPKIPPDWTGDTPPAPGWEWRGPDAPGGERGGWVSPDGESLHHDPNHPPPIGPHTDWNDKNGGRWRIYPDGRCEPK